MTNTSISPLANALTAGDGGLFAPKAKLPLSQSLARGESHEPSSALARQAQQKTYTPLGAASSTNYSKDVLTEKSGSSTANYQHLVGTLNWVLARLRHLKLIDFVLNTEDNRYEIWLPVSTWVEKDTVLYLAKNVIQSECSDDAKEVV